MMWRCFDKTLLVADHQTLQVPTDAAGESSGFALYRSSGLTWVSTAPLHHQQRYIRLHPGHETPIVSLLHLLPKMLGCCF